MTSRLVLWLVIEQPLERLADAVQHAAHDREGSWIRSAAPPAPPLSLEATAKPTSAIPTAARIPPSTVRVLQHFASSHESPTATATAPAAKAPATSALDRGAAGLR